MALALNMGISAQVEGASPSVSAPQEKKKKREPVQYEPGMGIVLPNSAIDEMISSGKVTKRWMTTNFTIQEKIVGRPKTAFKKRMNAFIRVGNDSLCFPRMCEERLRRGGFWPHVTIPAPHSSPHSLQLANYEGTAISSLFPYQKETIDRIMANQFAPASHRKIVYLQMDTGTGKTRIGSAFVELLKKKSVIVVPTEAIRQQWVKEIQTLLPAIRCLCFSLAKNGEEPVWEEYDVVVGIINTMCKRPYTWYSNFGFVIFDEAHEYSSDVYSKILWNAQTEFTLGLSATPTMKPDGLDRYVMFHLGDPVKGSSMGSADFECVVRTIHYEGNPDNCETVVTKAGMVSAVLTIGKVIEDTGRLEMITEVAMWLYKMKDPKIRRIDKDISTMNPMRRQGYHGIYIFAEHREFLPIIKSAMLKKFKEEQIVVPELEDGYADGDACLQDGECPPDDDALADEMSVLRGGVAQEYIEKTGRIAIITYGFGRRGLSLPQMTAMIFASPRKTGHAQIVGRILRRNSDNTIRRVIVDIVDTRVCLRSQYKSRFEFYKSRQYPVFEQQVRWDNPKGVFDLSGVKTK